MGDWRLPLCRPSTDGSRRNIRRERIILVFERNRQKKKKTNRNDTAAAVVPGVNRNRVHTFPRNLTERARACVYGKTSLRNSPQIPATVAARANASHDIITVSPDGFRVLYRRWRACIAHREFARL